MVTSKFNRIATLKDTGTPKKSLPPMGSDTVSKVGPAEFRAFSRLDTVRGMS